MNDERRFRIALWVCCLLVTAASLWTNRERDGLRNPDEAAYAEQARSILDRDRLELEFVRHYHVQTNSGVTHAEDFYPPGNGALIALSWTLFGRTYFANAIPSILIAGLLLPLLSAALARRLGCAPAFAFGCGIMVLFEPLFREYAWQGLADLPFCATVLGSFLAILNPHWRMQILGGVILALGFWIKPTALLFGPALVAAAYEKHRGGPKQVLVRAFAFGWAFLAVAAPWLIRNVQEFGDALYSGNKHLTASANDPNFVFEDIRKVYWARGDGALPTFTGSWTEFAGGAIKRFLDHVYTIVVDFGAQAFGFAAVLAALIYRRERNVLAVTTVCVTFVVLLSAVFAVFLRYLMPLFPLAIALSWLLADRVAQGLQGLGEDRLPGAKILAQPGRVAIVLAALAALPQGIPFARDLVAGKGNFVAQFDQGQVASAEWARDNLPADAIVMAHEAIRFHDISGLRTLNTPWDTPGYIEIIVAHHRATYIFQTFEGNSASISNGKLTPYLQQYAEKWEEVEQADARFVVWKRR